MIKAFLGKHLASRAVKEIQDWSSRPLESQENWLHKLLSQAKDTTFGKEHDFGSIKSYEDFKKAVPIREYEDLKPYYDRLKEGEKDLLWPGHPLYFAKTSGTTQGTAKYIPLTEDSMPNHVESARQALYCYIHHTGNNDFLNRKMLFISGNASLDNLNGIPTGRLSGIVNHHVPWYLKLNQLPSFETNCIDSWEEKLENIIQETEREDLGFLSGIPPWVQMYLEKISEKKQQKIKDLFQNLSVFVHGGVNFHPYKEKLINTIGKSIDTVETYPTSEGFIAFQDKHPSEGLLLLTNSGIFFEFVPLSEFHKDDPPRLSLQDVETGVNYVVIVNNNAGLWGYNLGDTVRFVSTNPYRLVVTGRVKQFISAFGEHVIVEEIEQAMVEATHQTGVQVKDFTVAPLIKENQGESHHQWFIEFEKRPENLNHFRHTLDQNLQKKNLYYKDLVESGILEPLHVLVLRPGGFNEYLRSIGQIGMQNKVPRVRNDRQVAEGISDFIERDHPVNQQFIKEHVRE